MHETSEAFGFPTKLPSEVIYNFIVTMVIGAYAGGSLFSIKP